MTNQNNVIKTAKGTANRLTVTIELTGTEKEAFDFLLAMYEEKPDQAVEDYVTKGVRGYLDLFGDSPKAMRLAATLRQEVEARERARLAQEKA